MKAKKFQNKYILRLDKGEEIVKTIKKFCVDNDIKLASITGIGAADKLTIGLFETKTKKYISKDFAGDFEICPLVGNISTKENVIYLHLHVNIADRKHNSYGGHLDKAVVSATFEAIIDVIDGKIDRKYSEEIGLNLLEF